MCFFAKFKMIYLFCFCFCVCLAIFFLFLLPSLVFGRSGKSFSSKFRQLFWQTCITKIRNPSLDTPESYCVYVLKFLLYENGTPCALEMNSNGGSRRRYVESCTSTTKKMLTPPSQFLCQTWQDSELPSGVPTHKITWLFGHVVLWDDMAITPLPEWLWPSNFAESQLVLLDSYP